MVSKLEGKAREEIAKKTKKIYKVTHPNGTYEEFRTSKTARKYAEKNNAIKVEMKNTKIEVTESNLGDVDTWRAFTTGTYNLACRGMWES